MRELLRQLDVTRHYVARGIMFWVGLRLLHGIAMLLAGVGAEWLEPSPLMPVVVAAAGFVDLRMRRELTLLANLGLSGGAMTLPFLVAGLFGELAFALAHLVA